MKQQIDNVKDFHSLTNNPWHEKPLIPMKERCQLRANLITEEASEFEKAVKEGRLVDAADGLIDLLYVTYGSLGELGLANIAEDLFQEVHRSNMSKACKTEQEAIETVKYYDSPLAKQDRCKAAYKANGDYFLVYRISDGKTLKSINYSRADLYSIIESELTREDDQAWAEDLKD